MRKYSRSLFPKVFALIFCAQITAAPIVNTPVYASAGTTNVTFFSQGSFDGWLLESTETSGVASSTNTNSKLIYLGDDAANRQYRAVLAFDTSTLPDEAIVTGATLKFRHAGVTGTLPFNTHGTLRVDMIKGSFSNNSALQVGDFKATASRNNVLSFTSAVTNSWYSKALSSANLGYINLTGSTQFRLRFNLDDNNDSGADSLIIYSGNSGYTARPQLVISYILPPPMLVHDTAELIAAINLANSNGASNDTIELATGDYIFTSSYVGNTALPIITSVITMKGNNNVLQRDIAALDFRILQVGSQGSLTLSDLTIHRGIAGGINDGGGIMNEGIVNLNNVTFMENAGDMGGAIYNAGQLNVSNSTFMGNHAGKGGGIYSAGTGLTVNFVEFDTNFASYGGGLYLNSAATITNSIINGNSGGCCGGWGGGIYIASGLVSVVDSIISGNRGYFGAAINVNLGNLTLTNVQVINNENLIPNFGAIMQNTGTMTITGSLLGGNLNGGMVRLGGSTSLSNSCIVNNSPNESGYVIFSNSANIQAANNWWGDPSGPSGSGPGVGDPVGSNVVFSPFATSAILTCPVADADLSGFDTNPSSPSVPINESLEISTKIFGTGDLDHNAQWQVLSGSGSISSTTGETITFTAPATPGVTVLRVTPDADPTMAIDVEVNTPEIKNFIIDPHAPVRVLTNGTVKIYIHADLNGSGLFPFTWTLLSGTGSLGSSTLYNQGFAEYVIYHAPNSPGNAVVRVRLKFFPDYYLDIPVEIVSSGDVSCSSPSNPLFGDASGSGVFSIGMGGLVSNQPGASLLRINAPFDPVPNEAFSVVLRAYVNGTAIDPITQVNLRFDTDNINNLGPYPMAMDSGTGFDGYWKWEGSLPDSICENYIFRFELINAAYTSNLAVAPRSR